METNLEQSYDERELIPLLKPSSCHPSSTVRCEVSSNDDRVGEELSRLLFEKYGDSQMPPEKFLVHFAGEAGDYFGRNLAPGVTFVVDAIGDYGCAKLNGGMVVVLSHPGSHFASGMKNGFAYVYFDHLPTAHRHRSSLSMDPIPPSSVEACHLRALIAEHVALTDSERGRRLLDNWPESLKHFVRITGPHWTAPAA